MSATKPRQPQLFIAGEWRAGGDGSGPDILNPSTGETLTAVPLASAYDLEDALDSVRNASAPWAGTPAVQRSAILVRAAHLLRQNSDETAAAITREQGKPLNESRVEVQLAAETLEWFAGEALRAYGRTIPARVPESRQSVITQPVGPVLALAPWNFPLLLPVRKVSAALAAGCPVILKPAEEAPSACMSLAWALHEAGLPAGTLNLVLGNPPDISTHLIRSKIIRKVSFTGSTPVGRELSKLAAESAKPSTMELGGHAPVIIFDDIDVDRVVATAVGGKTRNAGQVCTSPTRFIIHDNVYDEFVSAFGEALSALQVGDGFSPDTEMGPLANSRRVAAIEEMVSEAVSAGARLVTGGKCIGGKGNFFQPTLLADVPTDVSAMTTEPFGPLALATRFTTAEEALGEAHRLDVGLAAYIFTSSARNAHMASERLEAGGIGINSFSVSSIEAPFGGLKDSGHGYEGGFEGLDGYLHHKYINHVM